MAKRFILTLLVLDLSPPSTYSCVGQAAELFVNPASISAAVARSHCSDFCLYTTVLGPLALGASGERHKGEVRY